MYCIELEKETAGQTGWQAGRWAGRQAVLFCAIVEQ